ncbi:hypothetical protein [Tsukamurella hominis]|uniref:hypothetical protein n=1 Tax=Tsukamurella hominis TaxID=1970232 RepID=UPI0039EB48C1
MIRRAAARARWAVSDLRIARRTRAASELTEDRSTGGGFQPIAALPLTDAAIGAAIASIRTRAGIAVDDAALSAAIDAELLHAVERGQTACTVLILDALVRGLDSTVDEVLRIAHLRVATDQLCRADDVV